MSKVLASDPVTFYSFRVGDTTHYVMHYDMWMYRSSRPPEITPPPVYKLYTWETLPMVLKMRLVTVDTSEEMNENLKKAGRSLIEYPGLSQMAQIPEHLKLVGYRLNKSFYGTTRHLPQDLAIQVEAVRKGGIEECYDRLRTYMFYFTKKELEELKQL